MQVPLALVGKTMLAYLEDGQEAVIMCDEVICFMYIHRLCATRYIGNVRWGNISMYIHVLRLCAMGQYIYVYTCT